MDSIVDTSYMRDNAFDFNTPLLSSNASSPTYDSCDPFTPRSGRSTPHGSSIDFSESFSSADSFASFNPAHTMKNQYANKTDTIDMPFQYPAAMPLTPSRRMNSNYPSMDVDYNTMLQVNLSQQCMPGMSPAHPHMNDPYADPQELHSSPFNMPTPSRSLPSSTPGHAASMWPCYNDSPIMMFHNNTGHTPSPSPLKSMSTKRDSQSPSPTSGRSSQRRSLYEAQRRTMALQRHQMNMYQRQQENMTGIPLSSNKMDRPVTEEDMDSMLVGSRVTPRARERCNFMGCSKTYQKREHLKRHQRAAHSIGGTPETYTCPADGCHKKFKDRFDNFKQHLNIHKNGKSTRTPYNEEAARLYDELCKISKTRNVKRNGSRSDTD